MLKYDQSFWEEMGGQEKGKTLVWSYITSIMLIKTRSTPNK